MRVITGTARGRRLVAPPGAATRPTSDRVKEAIFSIIQFEIEQADVIDLFAGSGQLGIEALSRGARAAVFVDSAREAQTAIRENLTATGLAERARVVAGEAASFLSGSREKFDILLLDPPYQKGILQEILPMLEDKIRPGGIILCESELKEEIPENVGLFSVRRDYRYGKTKVTTFRQP
jgi:16S rRNA (guanine(966)-N(2))-methyltransferase RsmD